MERLNNIGGTGVLGYGGTRIDLWTKWTGALVAFLFLLTGCGPKVPETFTEHPSLPHIYPDYVNVTIPANIAPLTFELDEPADEMIACYSPSSDKASSSAYSSSASSSPSSVDSALPAAFSIVCSGKMQPSLDDWHSLTAQTRGGAIRVDVFARRGDTWQHYQPFNIFVSTDSIDPYLSYRLIPPSFISYEALTISQRCLENYDESVIYDNVLCSYEKEGQCINCHHYQQYNPDRMQFHARQNHGGTVIAYDGIIRKIDMRNDSILSAGVYPAWHPWLRLIVYSTDKTLQSFHITDPNKIEVYDTQSDLIAYDIDRSEVTNLENDPDEFEVFPAWAPDGKTLYYCSAHFPRKDTTKVENSSVEMVKRIKELKYNIYKKSFDPETMQFGPRELVYDGEGSATLPRISPDGRFMVITMAPFGYFHIWHRDADLWIVDLKKEVREETGEEGLTARPLDEINSGEAESYHSWSSNGRWLVFSSRRDDGVFTRPFIAHVDSEGHCARPFELPVANPDYHRQFMRSYNIPEFMLGPVTIDPQSFADVLKGDGEPVKYVQQ